MKRLIVIGILSLQLVGCSTVGKTLGGAFDKPSLSFLGMDLGDISLSGLTLMTKWVVKNPNRIGLKLAAFDYKLLVDGKQVVAGSPPLGLDIPANGQSVIQFPASFKFTEVAETLLTFVTKDKAQYTAEGSVGLDTPIGVVTLPLSKTGDFVVPHLPKIAFGDPKVQDLSLTGATLSFPLNVHNVNGFPLPLGGIIGNLQLAGIDVGSLETGKFGLLGSGETKTVTLPLKINFLQSGMALANAIRKEKVDLNFKAQVESGGGLLPLEVSQLVKFLSSK